MDYAARDLLGNIMEKIAQTEKTVTVEMKRLDLIALRQVLASVYSDYSALDSVYLNLSKEEIDRLHSDVRNVVRELNREN